MSGFTPSVWHDYSAPDLEAKELNRIEQGLVDLHDQLDSHDVSAADAIGKIETSIQAANDHLGDFNNPDGVTPAMVGAPAVDTAIGSHLSNFSNPHRTTAKQIGLGGGRVNAQDRGVSPAGTGIQNTTILQALLDELYSYGGGELYIPWGAGTVVGVESLWVPGNVRIFGNGCTIRKTREGIAYVRGVKGNGETYSASALLCVREQNLLGRAAPSNVVIEGLVLQGAEGFVSAIDLYADDCAIRNVTIQRIPGASGEPRAWMDCLYISDSERVSVEGCTFEYGGRNNISIVNGRYITIDGVTSRYCQAQKGDGLDEDLSPGCGLEVEPDAREQWSSNIVIKNSTFSDNAGAGVGFDLSPPGTDSVLDGHASDITIDNCQIVRNGKKDFMGAPGAAAGMTGGIFVTGGESSGGGVITITSCYVRDSVRGLGLHALDGRERIAAVGNDFRNNQAGAWNGNANFIVETGNLT